jgi:hypothetical protein
MKTVLLISVTKVSNEALFLSHYLLKEPASAGHIMQCIKDAQIRSQTPDPNSPPFTTKQLADITKQFILDIKLMAAVDLSTVTDSLMLCKEENKPLYQEYKKAMTSLGNNYEV